MTKEHEPTPRTRALVEAFSCAGYNQDDICSYLDISDDTLRKHYKKELVNAKMDKIEKLTVNAYKLAMEGDTKMIEFVLKCQGRWSYYKPPEEDAAKIAAGTLIEKLIDKL